MISAWMVRDALGMVREDPPLSLGGCVLARELLSEERDVLTRGERLKAALLAALDSLQPAGERDDHDPRWWPYAIYFGVVVEGESRAAIQAALAIAPTTYTRHRQKGFRWICGILPYLVRNDVRTRAVGELA